MDNISYTAPMLVTLAALIIKYDDALYSFLNNSACPSTISLYSQC